MKVTVIVRTYRRPEFLRECLASIAIQTHKDWELILFDDSADDDNFKIYKEFKERNIDKLVMYVTTKDAYDMFKQSWLISPDLSNGELMVRVDDDDLLASDALKFLSNLYEENPDLDFSYGSSVDFDSNDNLVSVIEGNTPLEHPKTRDLWTAYTIPDNHPWTYPWRFTNNYYDEPQNYTSIVHCSKANLMCVFHTYAMRTSSVKKVKDNITMTSQYVDDLEFLGSLDYLGLNHTSVKKILSYIRIHYSGKVSDSNIPIMRNDILKIRDKVDYLRTSDFTSNIIVPKSNSNYNNGIDEILKSDFKKCKKSIIDFLENKNTNSNGWDCTENPQWYD